MIANGFSVKAKKVVNREDLRSSLEEMFAYKGPYLLDITVEKEGGVFPMIEPGSSVSDMRLTYEL